MLVSTNPIDPYFQKCVRFIFAGKRDDVFLIIRLRASQKT